MECGSLMGPHFEGKVVTDANRMRQDSITSEEHNSETHAS